MFISKQILITGLCAIAFSAHSALTLDRSRIIFDEGLSSVSVSITNRNEQSPYLAQSWLEDMKEKKLTSLLMVLPPVQRVEPGAKTKVRIKALPDLSTLPKDRESVFYFNLREIPPKSDKPNVLMLAMQTRFKVFYRPASLKVDAQADVVPGTESLTLVKDGDKYILNNPSPYYFSIVEVRPSTAAKGVQGFSAKLFSPKSESSLGIASSALSNSPALVFINDYGSQRLLSFKCDNTKCTVEKIGPTASNS
ncbi:fimbria/pilus periplasmic chaperone [Kosakonia sacchari]|uniref:fimbria/pilus periplasmic chaperone n=1 Tax=Kosakonia sacchari TaxID=1158459 RepID=UPI002ACD5321|nr:fimbria/pilus periplasmic chaperone [Kosakonia sacchari]MDZ7320053.1 fimbria/pilus periplasmic chaperone [Kosakonia sacchari]